MDEYPDYLPIDYAIYARVHHACPEGIDEAAAHDYVFDHLGNELSPEENTNLDDESLFEEVIEELHKLSEDALREVKKYIDPYISLMHSRAPLMSVADLQFLDDGSMVVTVNYLD